MNESKKQPLVIPGLVKRRRDVQAMADHVECQFLALQHDIDALDKAILILDAEFNISSIKPNRYSDPSRKLLPYLEEVFRFLRESSKPLKVAELCDMLKDAGYPINDGKERHQLRDRVKNFLSHKALRGWVAKSPDGFSICDVMKSTNDYLCAPD